MAVRQFFQQLLSLLHEIISTSEHPPKVLARGAGIGIFVSFTPTVGIQCLILFLLWLLTKTINICRFDLKIAFTLTWITNYITAIPIYFIFYITGVLMGRYLLGWNPPLSYQDFATLWHPIYNSGFIDSFSLLIDILIQIGKPLMLGSLPYAIGLAVLAYRLTEMAVKHYRGKAFPKR